VRVSPAHTVSGDPDGPVVVLANSLGSTRAMWDGVRPALEPQFRVIGFDARGHGESPVPPGPYVIDDFVADLGALLDTIGAPRAHLVGLSLGGMTALAFAARHPERVDRLVALCTSAYLPPASGWRERGATVLAQGTGAVAQPVVVRWFTDAYRAAHPDGVAAAEAMVASIPPVGYAASCEAIAALDLRAELSRITAPTLALAGAEDPATPPEHLAAIAEGVADGRLVVLDRASHLAPLERPDAVAAAILEHLLDSERTER